MGGKTVAQTKELWRLFAQEKQGLHYSEMYIHLVSHLFWVTAVQNCLSLEKCLHWRVILPQKRRRRDRRTTKQSLFNPHYSSYHSSILLGDFKDMVGITLFVPHKAKKASPKNREIEVLKVFTTDSSEEKGSLYILKVVSTPISQVLFFKVFMLDQQPWLHALCFVWKKSWVSRVLSIIRKDDFWI